MIVKPESGKAEKMNRTLPFRAGVIMLLCVYLAVFVYSPVGVPHIHHEDDTHAGDACEKDACHIAIYHPGGEGSCDHKFHFTQTNKDCDFCQVVMPRQIITPETAFTELKVAICSMLNDPEAEDVKRIAVQQTDRGPPFLI